MNLSICDDEDNPGGGFARSFRVGAFNARSLMSDPAPRPILTPVAQLTDGQRDCLRLVFNHLTSKDIARILGVSPHTVDMRLRTSMKVLGVTSRIEAARLLMQEESGLDVAPEAYQPLIYQSPDMENAPENGIVGSPASLAGDAQQGSRQTVSPGFDPDVSGPPRNTDASITSEAAMLGSRSGAITTDLGESVRPLAGNLPWGKRNTLSIGVRLTWIAGIAMGSALSFGAILSALSSLKSLL
ncbi:helix-turn-helix transcriptional regulator [Polymorphobacter sp.]|uniref:helix-turn-helix transcriptional regulator n=1 Tax=Polymorphobacter sp. TaxID=1909290 RepID=UPI003F703361